MSAWRALSQHQTTGRRYNPRGTRRSHRQIAAVEHEQTLLTSFILNRHLLEVLRSCLSWHSSGAELTASKDNDSRTSFRLRLPTVRQRADCRCHGTSTVISRLKLIGCRPNPASRLERTSTPLKGSALWYLHIWYLSSLVFQPRPLITTEDRLAASIPADDRRSGVISGTFLPQCPRPEKDGTTAGRASPPLTGRCPLLHDRYHIISSIKLHVSCVGQNILANLGSLRYH